MTFGHKRLNEITRQQVQSFHTEVLASGLSPASADHHVKLIRHALNLAVEWEMLDRNPAAGVPLFNVDNKVEHYLSDAELEGLVSVLRTDANRPVCQVAMFLLSTGCRLNEALQATWGQVDRDNRVWRIPASNSKSKRVRSVPLAMGARRSSFQVASSQSGSRHLSADDSLTRSGGPYVAIRAPSLADAPLTGLSSAGLTWAGHSLA